MWTGIPAFFDLTGNNYFEKGDIVMAKDKLVEAITSMDVDFAQVYTDVVKKSWINRLFQCQRMHGHQTGRICDLGEHPERA